MSTTRDKRAGARGASLPRTAPRALPHPGRIIAGKYRLERPIARGGMGSLWVAEHLELDTEVAIKFVARAGELNSGAFRRFKNEAQAAARIKSPHVVHIYDYGIDEGAPYIAMELFSGEDLGQHLERMGRLSLARTAELGSQIAKGLECTHEVGIVHRDIKPKNLFLARFGDEEVLKVLDFGIAKQTRNRDVGVDTSQNRVLGSPAYMSPEQARGNPVSPRSDVWSFGAVVYRALTGVPPFVGHNAQDTVIKICTERPPRATEHVPGLPHATDAFFDRALAVEPSARYSSVSELSRALDELAEHERQQLPLPVLPKPFEAPPAGRWATTETLSPPGRALAAHPPHQRLIGLALAAFVAAAGILSLLWTRAPTESANASAQQSMEKPKTLKPEIPATRAAPESVAVSDLALEAPHTPSAMAKKKPKDSASAARALEQPAPALDPVFGLPLPSKKNSEP